MTLPGVVTNRPENRPLTSSWTSQARRFGASGVVNTLTDYVVFMMLTVLLALVTDRGPQARAAGAEVRLMQP